MTVTRFVERACCWWHIMPAMLALDFSTLLLVQAESLRATAETKDINIRIAHGMTVLQMRM